MKWILILMMWQSSYAGGALTTAEFDTKTACIAAATAVSTTQYASVKAYCYPSSEEN